MNPATVLAMSRHVLAVPKGEWLLQSAAGSTLGRMLIKLGRHDGFKTLNVVRRREAIAELEKLGGDAVIVRARRADRRAGAPDHRRRGRDMPSTQSGARRARASFVRWRPAGGLLLYGTLSGEPITVDPRLVISGPRSVEGFWLGHWMLQRSIPSALLLFARSLRSFARMFSVQR